MSRALPSILAVIAAATLTFAGSAQAAGGNYVFDGGTQAEQQQVRAGLNASSFDWSLVPSQITIHIGRGISTSYALPGQIWLDANLLDSGRFAWGTVQMSTIGERGYRRSARSCDACAAGALRERGADAFGVRCTTRSGPLRQVGR
jgi:opacity protein-like surface antigen